MFYGAAICWAVWHYQRHATFTNLQLHQCTVRLLGCLAPCLACTVVLEKNTASKSGSLKSGCRLGKLGVTVSSGLFRYRAAAYFVAEHYCRRRQNVSTLTAHIVAGDSIFRLSRHILSPVHNLCGRHISSPAPIYVDVHGT